MKLQKLKLDLEVVAFADGTGLQLRFPDIDRGLEAFHILQGELQSRFGQQDAHELLPHVEGESAFGVGDLGAGYRGLIACSLQTALALVAAFEQIRDAEVELLGQIEIFTGKITRGKNRDELGIGSENRVGTQVRGDLLCLILEDQSAGGVEGMVVGQGQIDGLIKANQSCRLAGTHLDRQQQEKSEARILEL